MVSLNECHFEEMLATITTHNTVDRVLWIVLSIVNIFLSGSALVTITRSKHLKATMTLPNRILFAFLFFADFLNGLTVFTLCASIKLTQSQGHCYSIPRMQYLLYTSIPCRVLTVNAVFLLALNLNLRIRKPFITIIYKVKLWIGAVAATSFVVVIIGILVPFVAVEIVVGAYMGALCFTIGFDAWTIHTLREKLSTTVKGENGNTRGGSTVGEVSSSRMIEGQLEGRIATYQWLKRSVKVLSWLVGILFICDFVPGFCMALARISKIKNPGFVMFVTVMMKVINCNFIPNFVMYFAINRSTRKLVGNLMAWKQHRDAMTENQLKGVKGQSSTPITNDQQTT